MVDLHGSDRDRGSFRFGLLLLLKSERMMIWKIKMREAFQTKRSARIIAVLTGAVIAVVAAGYLFFIIRTSIRCPASFILLPDCIVRDAVPGGQVILFYMEDFIWHSGIIRCM